MKASKNFIALVPMGGQSNGHVAQHAAPDNTKTYSQAYAWAKNRFSRPSVIVEVPGDVVCLDIEKAKDLYFSQVN